ncbi:hypothetical protein L596_018665 [Steinernema carpocapsae]|uniref:K Homology domain-containing protein n=1 Tax=Steinernema carpocapsae TaxID=34508 RepID=A0A4U5N5T1_STECR|nr:hypothetical protein L596_018665 [Steinernema carpocapsae]
MSCASPLHHLRQMPSTAAPAESEDDDQRTMDLTQNLGPSPSSTTPQMSMLLTVRLLMQGKEVGSIIGKRGDHIKYIRDQSAAKINISDGSCPERIVTITGSTETINKAFLMICQKFQDDMQAQPNRSANKPPITMRLIVPATQCGSLIGKSGSKIKQIRDETGASIQVASEMLPGSTERAVTISGTLESLVACMQQICQILLEAPPKGATLPYKPKPNFDPLLIANSAAMAAAQQHAINTLLQSQTLQQQQQSAAAAVYAPYLNPELARVQSIFAVPRLSTASTTALLNSAPATGGSYMPGAAGTVTSLSSAASTDQAISSDPTAMIWQGLIDDKQLAQQQSQLDLLNQYQLYNNRESSPLTCANREDHGDWRSPNSDRRLSYERRRAPHGRQRRSDGFSSAFLVPQILSLLKPPLYNLFQSTRPQGQVMLCRTTRVTCYRISSCFQRFLYVIVINL